MNSKYISIAIVIFLLFGSTGCGSKKIFENELDKYQLVALNDGELINNNFYIKDGTKFYNTYMPEGTVSGITSRQSDSRIFWMDDDEKLIPSYYKNELIAYPSEDADIGKVTVERYKNVGYSFGIYGAILDDDGYFSFSAKNNTIPGSDINNKLKTAKSDNIRLVTINDKPISEDMLNVSGIISGLKKDKSYKVGFYAGTYYSTTTVTADKKFLQSYEVYNTQKPEITKNGYLSLLVSEDAKCGYYLINGKGLFKYFDYEKGEKEDAKQNMNDAYYASADQQLAVYSQQYVVNVSEKTKFVAFNVLYDLNGFDNEDVNGILTAPDGTTYNMVHDTNNNTLTVELDEAIAGRWTVNISPKSLIIKDISAESTLKEGDALAETYQFAISDDDTNILFYADYKGDGTIWGIIENENGEARDMELDKKNNRLHITYPFLAAGNYSLTVYHYADTAISEVNFMQDESTQVEEIITVEE